MKKETKVSVYNLGGQSAGEINPEEIEYPWDANHISRVVLDDIVEISDIIDRAGGQTKFARLHEIPLRTVQDWAAGKRQPPAWLVQILDKITR